MLIRQCELVIPENDPFRYDALGRKELEPPLTQFINQAISPFTLALDGSWGSGKTTFLKMWKLKLQDAGHICLYLNAWKNDFIQEPLVAVVGELLQAIKDLEPDKKETDLEKNMGKVKQIAEAIAKRALPVGVKLLTNGIVNLDTSTEKILADFTGNITEDLVKEYEKGKSEIEEFTKAIEILANQVTIDNDDSKVVIIIDELDRCRPTYAVQLLERIKHLFGVEKVVFVLGIDRSQLIHSIKSLYGTEFDAVGYLRRFIDLDYQLPEPKLGDYCCYLFKHFGIEELILKRSGDRYGELQTLRAYLGILMSAARMSLREQEQTIARLRIVLQTIPFDYYLYPITLSILLFLREHNPNIYSSFVDGKGNIDEIISLVENLPSYREAFDRNKEVYEYSIEAHLLAQSYYLAKIKQLKFSSSRWNNYEQLSKSDLSEPEVKKAQYIVDVVSQLTSNIYKTSEIIATVNRLSFANQFVSNG